jgi:glycosyltransferase involved in cell wall biosynthesis
MAISKRGADRLLTRFELNRTEWYEGWLVNQFDQTLVTSVADKKALENLTPSPTGGGNVPEIAVLQNGVDLDHFSPGDETLREESTIVLSGKMSYHANITMALHLIQEIMPAVWAKCENVQVMIVGKDPPSIVKSLEEHPRVTVTGTVPELRTYLQQATIAVAPIRYGAGIQNKILEAMACATPVITTPKAVAGLQINPGENILVAEDTMAFANAILKLLADSSFREQMRLAGRQYVETHHNWGDIASQLGNIYTQVIGN